jgi:hypothetical protein
MEAAIQENLIENKTFPFKEQVEQTSRGKYLHLREDYPEWEGKLIRCWTCFAVSEHDSSLMPFAYMNQVRRA